MDKWRQLLEGSQHFIPFVLAAGEENRLSVPRIIEALIIAAVTGGVSVYATQLVLAERMQMLQTQVHEVKTTVDQMRRDLYAPRVR